MQGNIANPTMINEKGSLIDLILKLVLIATYAIDARRKLFFDSVVIVVLGHPP